jgi:hypothetical protein
MGRSRLVLFCCYLLFFSLLLLNGCGLRNQVTAGRDLHYSAVITVSPSAALTGAKLPGNLAIPPELLGNGI